MLSSPNCLLISLLLILSVVVTRNSGLKNHICAASSLCFFFDLRTQVSLPHFRVGLHIMLYNPNYSKLGQGKEKPNSKPDPIFANRLCVGLVTRPCKNNTTRKAMQGLRTTKIWNTKQYLKKTLVNILFLP